MATTMRHFLAQEMQPKSNFGTVEPQSSIRIEWGDALLIFIAGQVSPKSAIFTVGIQAILGTVQGSRLLATCG
jgi:hypothetical protein